MSAETPYRRTSTSKVHLLWCGVGGHGEPVTFEEVTEWVRRRGLFSAKGHTIASAACCGSTPEAWLRRNHPDTYEALMRARRVEDRG